MTAPSGQEPKPKRRIASKPKTKNGCITCRIRKIKCDEEKPKCRRCVSTGRTCDGWETIFRPYQHPEPSKRTHTMKQTHVLSLQRQTLRQFRGMPFATSEVMEVCHALSTKPPAGGGIGFETEALSILYYSSNSVLIRQALACLRVFRTLLMKHGTISNLRNSDMLAWWKSVRNYTTTVGDLTRLLTATDPYAVEVIMNCCQLFISIDMMQQEFASSVRHFAYGLRIMISCRLRPGFDSTGEGRIIAPTHRGLPALDIFTLKLFTAPCPYQELFIEDLQKASEDGPSKVNLFKAYWKSLMLIATETIDLLNRISSITSVSQAFMLSEEKERLLERLDEVEPRMKEEGFMGKNARTPVWKKMELVYLLYFTSIRVVLRSSLRSTNGASLEQYFDDLISIAASLETTCTSSQIALFSATRGRRCILDAKMPE